MRLGVPFIAPRQLGAVESIPGRKFLPSVTWRTGQSGAPPDTVRCGFLSFFGEADRWRFRAVGAPDTVRCKPDSPVHHRTLSGADFFPSLVKPTVGDLEPLAHRTLFGANRTVRCPLLAVGSAMCPARITRPTVGSADHWLTGRSGAPPDSPMIYSRTPPSKSRE
jgi:hypothetical protein